MCIFLPAIWPPLHAEVSRDVSGSNENAYNFPNDPVEQSDPDGQSAMSKLRSKAGSASDDTGATACAARQYAFDQQGNRTDLNSATGSSCPALGSGSDTTGAFDNYSRQTSGANGSGSYVYDAFGRQTTIPAADAPGGAGAAITLSYFDSDAVQSIAQTVGGTTDTTTFTVDPDGRRLTSTDVNGSTTTVTTNHYAGGSDNPAWLSQVSGSATSNSSYLPTLGSASAVVSTTSGTTTASLSLADLAGSVVASVAVAAGSDSPGISGFSSFDEYGNVETAGASTGVNTYGWEGAAQRAVTNAGLTLMGARVYNSATGRFTSTDPQVAGNENAYNYPNDPVNMSDLDGQWSKSKLRKAVGGRAQQLKSAIGRLQHTSSASSGHARLRQTVWGILEIIVGISAINIGTQIRSASAVEVIAGLFFTPESFGFSLLVTALGILETVVSIGIFAAGALLVVDGGYRITTGHGAFYGHYLNPPKWFLK